jgi:predicted nuclease of predicted toxin-antitoxin system
MGDGPTLRLFLDEGVPDSVGHAFLEAGQEVHFLNRTLARGSSDQLVCAIADINNAILVALAATCGVSPKATASARAATYALA